MVGWEKKEGTTLEATIASDLLLTMLSAMLSANTITTQNKVVIYSFRIFVLENARDEPVQSTSINLWTTNQEHNSALMSNQTKPLVLEPLQNTTRLNTLGKQHKLVWYKMKPETYRLH